MRMTTPKAVSAVMVSYNSAEDIGSSIAALTKVGLSAVYLVDNASGDASRELATAAGAVVLPQSTNLGFGKAVNRGVERVDTEFLLLVNPDCVIDSDAIEGMLTAIIAEPAISAVAPVMKYPDGSTGITGAADPFILKEILAFLRIDDLIPKTFASILAGLPLLRSTRLASYALKEYPPEFHDYDWVSGYCMLLRTAAFRDVGGFDDRFFLYFEDADLCRRLRQCGYRVGVVGDAQALHYESTSTGPRGKSTFYTDGMAVYFAIYGGRFAQAVVRILSYLVKRG
jgi:GT2 family glycosyltransferase